MSDFLDYEGLQRYHELISKKLPTSTGTARLVLTSAGSGEIPVWKTGELVHYVTNASGTAGTADKNRTQWTGTVDGVIALYTGLMVMIKVPVAGVNKGVTLDINSLGEHPVVINNSIVTTHYPVGTIMPIVYDADQKATVMISQTNTEITGCWKIANYDSNSDTYMRLYKQITNNTTWNKDYPLVASRTVSSSIAETDGKYASIYGLIGSNSVTPTVNPITGAVKVKSLTLDGTLLESKAAAASGTDLSLVTTGEKATWNAKTSNTGTVTKVTAGTGLTGGDITTTGTIALATSGVTAGTYKSVTVDTYGRVTAGSNPTDSDTKNTAGTTNNASKKMFLVGAESQAANPQTYSNSNCYIGTDNCLYSGGSKVLTSYTEQYTGTVTLVKVGTTAYNPSSGVVSLPDYPTTLPASDVSAWAKSPLKPTYTYPEIDYGVNLTSSIGGAIAIDPTYSLHEIYLTGAVSGITFATGTIPVNGHSCHVILTADNDLNVTIAHDATMATVDNVLYKSVCPQADDVTITITGGGYVELDLLRIGTSIYVRGI